MAWLLHSFDCSSEQRSMTLKIKQVAGKREITHLFERAASI